MDSSTITTPADELLSKFSVIDGDVLAIEFKPLAITLHVDLHSRIGEEWCAQEAKVTLLRPSGVSLKWDEPFGRHNMPVAEGHVIEDYVWELGDIRRIEARGPLDAASFAIEFGQNKLSVKRCHLSIEKVHSEPQAASNRVSKSA